MPNLMKTEHVSNGGRVVAVDGKSLPLRGVPMYARLIKAIARGTLIFCVASLYLATFVWLVETAATEGARRYAVHESGLDWCPDSDSVMPIRSA